MVARKKSSGGSGGSQKKKSAKKQNVALFRGKCKEAIARATACKGSGRVTINGIPLSAYEPAYLRPLLEDPLRIAGDFARDLDISVNVQGGGVVGQAKAIRTAIARALVAHQSALKEPMLAYDRFLLVEDVRRVEPKKFKGPKARARFQKSYR